VYTWINREEIISPCLPPLHYTVGTIDPEFQLSSEKFTSLVLQSEHLWENALGKDVFQYDPNASFTINLLYDERQSKTNQSIQLEKEIDSKKETYDQMTEKLDANTKTYETLTSQYTTLTREYEKEVAEYNKEVASWNRAGGAPEKEYDILQKKLKTLEDKRTKINSLIHQINTLADTSKNIVATINNTADHINATVKTHNNLFEDGEEFNKGICNRNQIDIYQFITQQDLLLTLVHEMGHSLFITEHTRDPQSIMYYLMKDQPTDSITLTKQDIDIANQSCRFDIQTPGEVFYFFLSQILNTASV
jgi:hypothetical protein